MADVRIDVKVDDKGSLKKVGKSAQSARRQVGGVARTASASGKQFSKMSQGITGGLVPAYAQLAATLFAVDAVFRALKESAELRVQREGMLAYAQSTGIAMQSVALNLQKATDAQLSFKEAASASAIGLAAGISATQIEEIGIAAKNASIALGRNFTDSFDRVLKGIVKGEPELLDELGIILRLETATRKYAQAMDLQQDKLTAWQRSQAVFNEVIGQATEKYAALGEGIQVSGITQLATALEDIKNAAMEGIAPIAEFFAGVFTDNMKAAIALLLVFVASIMNKIVPSLRVMKTEIATLSMGIGGGVAAGGKMIMGAGRSIRGDFRAATATRGVLAGRTQKAAMAMGPSKSIMVQQLAAGKKLNAAKLGQLKSMLVKAEAEWKKHGKITTGVMAGENIKKVRNLRIAVEQMKGQVTTWGLVVKSTLHTVRTTWKVTMMSIVGITKTSFAMMKLAARGLGMAMNAAMRLAGFIGMAVMIIQVWDSVKEKMDVILAWVGDKLKWLGNKIKEASKALEGMGLGFFTAGTENLGDIVTGWGNATEAKAKYMKEGLMEARRIKAIKKELKDLSESINKSNDELEKMMGKYKKGFDDIWDKRTWEGNFAKTIGASFQTDMAALIGVAESGNIKLAGDQIAELAEKMRKAEEVDLRYRDVADELELMHEKGRLTTTTMERFLKTLELTNTEVGSTGGSIDTLKQLTKEFQRLVSELNKGLGETRWDRLTRNIQNVVIEMEGMVINEAKRLTKEYDDYNILLEEAFQTEADIWNARLAYHAKTKGATGVEMLFVEGQLAALDKQIDDAVGDRKRLEGMAFGAAVAKGKGIRGLDIEAAKHIDPDKVGAMEDLAISWFGQKAVDDMKDFGDMFDKIILQYDFYLNLQKEARTIQLLQIENQKELMNANKWRGPFGQILKEEATIEQKILNLRQKQHDIVGATENLRLARIGVAGDTSEQTNTKIAAAKHALDMARGGVSIAKEELEIYKQTVKIGFKFANDLQAGFTNLWNNVIDGTKSLKDVLKATFRQIFIQLAQMIAQMLMVRALMAAIGWFTPTPTTGISGNMSDAMAGAGATWGDMPLSGLTSPGATGGIVKKYGIQGFGSGGIAASDTVPAMLTPGETVLTPSQLKNLIGNSAAMGTNNVTVNVSAQGQQQTTSNSSNQQAEIGRMIADAVTATLIEEQRPGGVLSPFGGGGP